MGYVIIISILIAIWDYSRKNRKTISKSDELN